MIVEKVSKTRAVYVIGTTLHVHPLHLCKKDELKFILLAPHLHLVNEVRIHNFHIDFFLTVRRLHVRITPTYWRIVQFILPYINRGPWVEHEGKRERAVRITFDDFLQLAVKAWRAGEPYANLIFDIPKYEIGLISSYTNLPKVHVGLSVFTRGHSSKSDMEVEIVHDTLHNTAEDDDEIVMAFGFPFFPIGHP